MVHMTGNMLIKKTFLFFEILIYQIYNYYELNLFTLCKFKIIILMADDD